MFVNIQFLAASPFIDAFILSDLLGKLIFLSLIFLSIFTWVILIQKIRMTNEAKKSAEEFRQKFTLQKENPLGLESEKSPVEEGVNPFKKLYHVLRRQTLDILHKNHQFGNGVSYLCPTDLDFVESHLMMTVTSQTKFLEKNLYLLATVVTLAPFLGLLGTVWGILTTFSELQSQTAGGTQQMILGGLSLALATTVLGLIDAIPALVGYNFLKSRIKDLEVEMTSFSTEMLSTVEMQYRKVEVSA